MNQITRRSFLKNTAALTGSLCVTALPNLSFAAKTQSITLTAREGTSPLATSVKGARPTRIWGYNGLTPGPTIRCSQGDRLKVRLVNELKQPTTIHWHGLRIQNDMDGVPGLTQAAVAPGASFDYEFTVPDAGTYWYHTHEKSWEQMARGLYGLLIVDEPRTPGFDKDIALAIDDWRLNPDGQIDEKSFGALHDWAHNGRLGNWLTVNGTSKPGFDLIPGEHVRLRLANVANARVFTIDFEHHEPVLIALDGMPVEPRPFKDGKLVLAPGQRADLSFTASAKPGARLAMRENSGKKPYEFAYFKYAEQTRSDNSTKPRALKIPASLPQLSLDKAVEHELVMEGGAMGAMRSAKFKGRDMPMRELVKNDKVWAFNGVAGDLDKPFFEVKQGQTVIINIKNDTQWQHAMHLHGMHFRVVKRAGRAVADEPWRDTVLMERQEKISIAFVADNPGKWLFHCHMIEHMAGGMVTWINVEA